jgi:hypothetical protein
MDHVFNSLRSDPYYEGLGLKLSELILTVNDVFKDNDNDYYNSLLKKLDKSLNNKGYECMTGEVMRISKEYLSELNVAAAYIKDLGLDLKDENSIIKGIEVLSKRITRYSNNLVARICKAASRDLFKI